MYMYRHENKRAHYIYHAMCVNGYTYIKSIMTSNLGNR